MLRVSADQFGQVAEPMWAAYLPAPTAHTGDRAFVLAMTQRMEAALLQADRSLVRALWDVETAEPRCMGCGACPCRFAGLVPYYPHRDARLFDRNPRRAFAALPLRYDEAWFVVCRDCWQALTPARWARIALRVRLLVTAATSRN